MGIRRLKTQCGTLELPLIHNNVVSPTGFSCDWIKLTFHYKTVTL